MQPKSRSARAAPTQAKKAAKESAKPARKAVHSSKASVQRGPAPRAPAKPKAMPHKPSDVAGKLRGPAGQVVRQLLNSHRSLDTELRLLRTQVARQSRLIDALMQGGTDPRATNLGSDRAAHALIDMQRRLGSTPVQSTEGVDDAEQQSEAAKARWIAKGRLVGSTELSAAWGRTRQALEQAVERGELFNLKIANRRWYPATFMDLDPASIKPVCLLLHGSDPVSKFLFWERRHGSLGGRTVPQALKQGDVQAAVRAAEGFAREQLMHVAAA